MKPLDRTWTDAMLEDDEQLVLDLAANRTQGKRAVGGSLHLTTQRLLFCPNALDSKLGGQRWACAIAEIASIGTQPRRFALVELFSGGLVERLRIDLHDGGRELFVVSKPAQRASELREHLGVPAPATELPAARVVR